MTELRTILEEYRKKIHGSEYDYHSKHCSLEEHNEYMRIVQYQAEQKIKELMLSEDEILKLITDISIPVNDEMGYEVRTNKPASAIYTAQMKKLEKEHK